MSSGNKSEDLGQIPQSDTHLGNCPIHGELAHQPDTKNAGVKIPIRKDRPRNPPGSGNKFRVDATVTPGIHPFGSAQTIEIPQNLSDAVVKSPSTGSRSPQRGSSPSSDAKGPVTPVHRLPVTKPAPLDKNSS